MNRLSPIVGLVLLLSAATAFGAQSPAAVTLFVPERQSASHPKETHLRVSVESSLRGPMWVCVEYGNTLEQADQGRVLVRLSVERDGRTVARRRFRGGVAGNHFAKCVSFGTSLLEGDVAVFRLQFKDFPRMTGEDAYVAFAGLIPK